MCDNIKMTKSKGAGAYVGVYVAILTIICIVFLTPNVSAAEDTGTYQIQEYNVVLTPHSNGDIEISYMQKWLVTGGHIPWVTVGLANSNFDIRDFGGAAQAVTQDNQGDWSGVKIDLDRDYQPQETFQFNFTVIQRALLERSGDEYRLGFTPGWYDRAFTDKLTITLISPVKDTEKLLTLIGTFSPQPDSVEGQDVIWTRKNLGKGEKFTISVGLPNGTINQTLMEQSQQSSGSTSPLLIFIIVILVVLGVIVVVAATSSSSDDESRNRSSYYSSPVIYSGGSKGGSHSHSSGEGGGFGGRSTSCVVSCACACACACAGGGGAGCTRKFRHSCSKCGIDENEYKSPRDKRY